jgi:hypothetical protein
LGSSNPTQHGHCWATTQNPTTDNFKTTLGEKSSTGAFTSSLTGLSAGTLYYVRAYATNTTGTSYGGQVSFTTIPAAPVAGDATAITQTGFTANWASSSGATGYYLDVATNSAFTGYYVSGYQDLDVGNVTSMVVSGLSELTTYFYRVRAYNANGTSASSNTIEVSTIATPVPSITVSPESLNDFSYVYGNGPSVSQSFTVCGVNLSNAISLTAPTNYEISLSSGSGYSGSLSLSLSDGSVANTTIYTRLKAGLEISSYTGESITAISGAITKSVVCSGSVTAFTPTLLLMENFDYSVATPLTDNGWVETGTTANPVISVSNGNLSYIGYPWSSGNLVSLAASGQDVNRSFAQQTSGAIYSSLLVNVTSAQNGDYFYHFGPASIGSNYYGRVFLQRDGTTDRAFVGLVYSSGTGATVYTTSSYPYNTTILLVLKYQFVEGASNDVVSLFVNPVISATEPTPTLTSTSVITDPANIGSIALRQGGNSSSPVVKIDGIRVTDSWAKLWPDYPQGGQVAEEGGATITMTNGNANISSTPASGAPNASFVPVFARVLTLIGTGPWSITLSGSVETVPWFAYKRGANWTSYANTTGSVSFEIPASKDAEIEIQGGSGGNPTLPVELSSFSYTINANNLVTLQWVTQTETNVLGYYIYRGKSEEASEAVLVSDMIAATNTSTTQSYVFVDNELQEQGTYYYWLQNLDMDGSNAFHGPVRVDYSFTEPGTPNQPLVTALNRVYPNPFNPTTFINYSLSENSPVQFKIYNNRGQLVRTLTNVPATAGNHRVDWNGTDENGSSCSTGLYLIRMEAGKDSFTRKVVLVK